MTSVQLMLVDQLDGSFTEECFLVDGTFADRIVKWIPGGRFSAWVLSLFLPREENINFDTHPDSERYEDENYWN